jgi:hypothetical protein
MDEPITIEDRQKQLLLDYPELKKDVAKWRKIKKYSYKRDYFREPKSEYDWLRSRGGRDKDDVWVEEFGSHRRYVLMWDGLKKEKEKIYIPNFEKHE